MTTEIIAGFFGALAGGSLAAEVFRRLGLRREKEIEARVVHAFEQSMAAWSSQREHKERLVSELLGPLTMQLHRTSEAFRRWDKKNLFLEAAVIRQSNTAARDLLLTKGFLLPADLLCHAVALVTHYDMWLEEYERVRLDEQASGSTGFVFVGPKGYPFPKESEAAILEAFTLSTHELFSLNARDKKLISACEKHWDAQKANCSGFVKAIAGEFGITLTGQADAIVDQMKGEGWEAVRDGAAAAVLAESGRFVLAGLKGAEHRPVAAHGHVVVVVGKPLAHAKYPCAYWGTLGGEGKKDTTLNYAWNKTDRDAITYSVRAI
jgi:hypothetical protein